MALSNIIKEQISIEIIKVLVAVSEFLPANNCDNFNSPFFHAFADKLAGKVSDTPFFISLSSWLQGLNTTLGQTFFENVAHYLCEGEKREYTSKKIGNLKITQNQRDAISRIIADLSNTLKQPNLHDENSQIFQNDDSLLINALDFSTDVFFETDNSVTAIELKSVKPNSGEMRGEKQKILEGKAALYRLFPNKKIYFYIGFPFDPTVNPTIEAITSYNKPRFLNSIINMNKYFAHDETLVASELWNFLSGEKNTMEEVLEIINIISTTDFLSKFQLLIDNSKRSMPEYLAQLQEWNLFSEQELIEHNDTIFQRITPNLTKIYNKMAFDTKGNYNWERYNILKNLL
ncbi:type II restriction endonuclease MjaII [Bacteroidia bacterium]|nr:type II restriction endonuclease MjaII [Bacteroidia bacterium]